MKIRIVQNDKGIIESIEAIREILPDLNSSTMYFYYPFRANSKEIDILSQIHKDKSNIEFKKRAQVLMSNWRSMETEIFRILEEKLKWEMIPVRLEYRCVLTCYGPHGFFYTPNTVYVNISEKDVVFWLETLLHELLHLFFQERYIQLSAENLENQIDKLFVELFGVMFPNYRAQETSA